MNLRSIYEPDFRVMRAVHIENAPPAQFGQVIDDQIKTLLSGFSVNAKGYKVEDGGILVGYYIVDYTAQGMPFVPLFAVRKVYSGAMQIISEQIQQWSAQEYRRQSSN